MKRFPSLQDPIHRALVLAAIGSVSFSTVAHPQNSYYANGKEIPLATSDRYFAYELKPDADLSRTTLRSLIATVPRSEPPVVVARAATAAVKHLDADLNGTREKVEGATPVFVIEDVNSVPTQEVIVRFSENAAEADVTAALQPFAHKAAEDVKGKYILTIPGDYEAMLAVANNLSAESAIVRYAQPNFTYVVPAGACQAPAAIDGQVPLQAATADAMAAAASSPTNDPLFEQQWALSNRGTIGKPGADAGVARGWSLPHAKGLDTVTIAIIDEGVDQEHPDLKPKIVKPYDTIEHRASAQPQNHEPHGTACAGIAAAVTSNKEGIAGIGWNVRLMPIRVAERAKQGSEWVTSDDAIASGFRKAIEQGADVISASLVSAPSTDVTDAIYTAVTKGRGGKGTVVVLATGNNDRNRVHFPARLARPPADTMTLYPGLAEGVIAVGATNQWDEHKSKTSLDGETWWGSNFGPEITVTAPGVSIVTTDINGPGGYIDGKYVSNFNGTSAATPHVAGLAAVLISAHPDWTAAQVKAHIVATADDRGPAGFDQRFGHGRINFCRALGGTDCGAS